MADSDFLYKIGRRFYMPWGEGKKMIFVVIDRMHTERGNMYWLQNRVRPKFTQLFWEDYLAEGRRPDALEMFEKRWDRSLKGGLQPPPEAPPRSIGHHPRRVGRPSQDRGISSNL